MDDVLLMEEDTVVNFLLATKALVQEAIAFNMEEEFAAKYPIATKPFKSKGSAMLIVILVPYSYRTTICDV